MRFDPQRLAELVAEESRLTRERQELSIRLNEMKETDEWNEAKKDEYQRLSLDHMRLESSLRTAIEARSSYELREPNRARRRANSPLSRWMRDGAAGLESPERDAMLSEIRDAGLPNGGGETFVVTAATASDAASGEEAMEETVVPRVIDRLLQYGGVDRMCQRFSTATGNDYRIPQMDATAQKGEILDAQNTETADQDIPNIGVVNFGVKTYSTKSMLVTREMLQDSIIDIESYVQRQAVRRIGRISNEAFTKTQPGTGLPIGVVSSAKDGLTAASAIAVTWTELTELIYKIDPAYREGEETGEGGFMAEGGRLGYMISDDFERLIRVLVDSDSRPLWVPSTREGVPNMLNGHGYEKNYDMDSVATGNVPCLYGHFGYYGIRTVASLELFRFQDSRTMQRNTVEFLGFARRDARPMGALVSDECEAYAKLTMA